MSGLRLVLVTPRYWPQVGETERFAANLGAAFRSRDADVTVLTARWSADWPGEVVHCEMRTVRLPHAPLGGWHTFRYLRSLSQWLRRHHRELDVVYVMNLRLDAYAAVGAVRGTGVATVLRANVGDCSWLATAALGRRVRRRIAESDAIVAPTQSLASELRAAGHAEERVRCIENGVDLAEPRNGAGRHQARVALAEANPELAIAEYAPLAVCLGRFQEHAPLWILVDAWREIAARWPSARLWLLGDGPLRAKLLNRVEDFGLYGSICMPGTFDDLAEILLAADVLVSTSHATDGGQYLLEAMAAGLPVIATDAEENRELVQHNVHGLLVPQGSAAALADAIATLFDAPRTAERLGEAGRRLATADFSLARMIHRHEVLFEQILARRRRGSK